MWHLKYNTLNFQHKYNYSSHSYLCQQAGKADVRVRLLVEGNDVRVLLEPVHVDTYNDGQGNEVAIEKARKKASKADLKKIKKAVAAKRKAGEECYTDEELENAGFLAEY